MARKKLSNYNEEIMCLTSLNRNIIFFALLISFVFEAYFMTRSERWGNKSFNPLLSLPTTSVSCEFEKKSRFYEVSLEAFVVGKKDWKLANIANHKCLVKASEQAHFPFCSVFWNLWERSKHKNGMKEMR